jgi:uncharacterized C2H2 Zn-finger protein
MSSANGMKGTTPARDEEQMNTSHRSSQSMERPPDVPRFVQRNLDNHQSRNRLAIENDHITRHYGISWVLKHDWYHVLLGWNTFYSIVFLLALWTFWIIMFAVFYQTIDRSSPEKDCGLGIKGNPIEFHGAFAFSLETCTTVGYGLPSGTNAFFVNCPGLQLAIYLQMVWSMLFNALILAFFFARLGRCDACGTQLLFSNKTIIEKKGGKWLFHARVYNFDSAKPLIEAHVRLYTANWNDYNRPKDRGKQPSLWQTTRVLSPSDGLGSVLYTSIPTYVTHHIDAYSPLLPPLAQKSAGVVPGHGLVLREADSDTFNRDGYCCPVCGETYASLENLKRHINYTKLYEKKDKTPIESSHQDETIVTPELTNKFVMSEDELRESLKDKEVILVVEGIEPLVSGTFQALQSYTAEDVQFGGTFVGLFLDIHVNCSIILQYFLRATHFGDMAMVRNFHNIKAWRTFKIYPIDRIFFK